jgi:hypothetical protein
LLLLELLALPLQAAFLLLKVLTVFCLASLLLLDELALAFLRQPLLRLLAA